MLASGSITSRLATTALVPPTLSELLSPRGVPKTLPHRPPRPADRAPPSIPVADQAWGYEEGEDGTLVLQQPTPPRGSPCGPGAYSPTPFPLPAVRDFGHYRPRPPFITNAEDKAQPRYAETLVPKRMPLPLATMLQRKEPRHQVRAMDPPPPSPGPGAFDSPRGVGDTGRIRHFPRQVRHYSRGHVKLPLTPAHRAQLHYSPRAASMIGGTLHVRRAPVHSAFAHAPSPRARVGARGGHGAGGAGLGRDGAAARAEGGVDRDGENSGRPSSRRSGAGEDSVDAMRVWTTSEDPW
jgi:hypothetical protein